MAQPRRNEALEEAGRDEPESHAQDKAPAANRPRKRKAKGDKRPLTMQLEQ